MRIAFLSYEFPPETGGGGIGTYLIQAAKMLSSAGHEVEIFAGTSGAPRVIAHSDGYKVHRVPCASSPSFAADVVEYFSAQHRLQPFEVIEATDFDASALEVKRVVPDVPCVVKLHTPRFVIDQLHWRAPSVSQRLRMAIGAIRQGRRPGATRRPGVSANNGEVRQFALADEIASPSQAIADRLLANGYIRANRVSVFPYPYAAPESLLAIPVATNSRRIMFLGRLEERKGVLDLATAIPLVVAKCPWAKFCFVGRSMPASDGTDMRSSLNRHLRRYESSVEIIGPVASDRVAELLGNCDVLVAPSHWESFGLVCCEGMAAARAVIGSQAGGMAEILDGGRCGILIEPHAPAKLADELINLLTDNNRRQALGIAGRKRLLEHFSHERVLPLQVASYHRAIKAQSERAMQS